MEPFRALARCGPLALAQAVLTDAGRLPFRGIIHVAAITLWGRSNLAIIRTATRNALALARENACLSVAFPVLGSGSGGLLEEQAIAAMMDTLRELPYDGHISIVSYQRNPR